MGKPQMPRPHNGSRGVLNRNDGVAVFDIVSGNVEVDIGVGATARHRQIIQLVAIVSPHKTCLSGRIVRVLHIDVRRGDIVTKMILKITEDVLPAIVGLVRAGIVRTGFNSIAIN